MVPCLTTIYNIRAQLVLRIEMKEGKISKKTVARI